VIQAGTFNELVVEAILAYIGLARRKQIDLAFAPMADDAVYLNEAHMIMGGFEESDWEALEVAEKTDV